MSEESNQPRQARDSDQWQKLMTPEEARAAQTRAARQAYDPLIRQQEQLQRLRGDESREMARFVRLMEQAPDQLRGEQQKAANIGTQFGAQIRDAARTAAQARIEQKQQQIESQTKPGVDMERVSASLRSAVNNAKEKGNPQMLVQEILAMERTTSDPLALQLIRRVKTNLETMRPAFEGTSVSVQTA
jgi:DNA-binding helix-hairpin-helix protein with protein kinase domain